MSRCKTCGRPVIWATTTAGKAMPVDPLPSPDGHLLLFPAASGRGQVVAHEQTDSDEVREAVAEGRHRYTSHFATCPQAAAHRKVRA